MANAIVGSVAGFFGFRVALGVTESPAYVSAARATKIWLPKEKQNVPTGVWNSTSSLGPGLAPLLLTALTLLWGWRAMFVVIGAVGLVLGVVWFAYHRDRPAEESDIITQMENAPHRVSLKTGAPSSASGRPYSWR